MELWKEISNTNGKYYISSWGNVMSKHFKKKFNNGQECILQPSIAKNGYEVVNIGRGNTQLVHRLVADAFLPNPDNFDSVDHIDRNKTNNDVSNLRWASRTTQTLNTNKNPTNIIQHGDGYRVRIVRKHENILYKTYPTLEEAIRARDECLLEIEMTLLASET